MLLIDLMYIHACTFMYLEGLQLLEHDSISPGVICHYVVIAGASRPFFLGGK